MDLRELWVLLEADLGGARRTLLASAEENTAGLQYQEFIDHNELELACDMLAAYALDHPVSRECWVALRDAAAKMNLPEQASLYDRYGESL
jgi:hypothetical protein